ELALGAVGVGGAGVRRRTRAAGAVLAHLPLRAVRGGLAAGRQRARRDAGAAVVADQARGRRAGAGVVGEAAAAGDAGAVLAVVAETAMHAVAVLATGHRLQPAGPVVVAQVAARAVAELGLAVAGVEPRLVVQETASQSEGPEGEAEKQGPTTHGHILLRDPE